MGTLLKAEPNWQDLARKANYSTAGLANVCGMSVRQLEREFLRTFGQTPEQWINDLRLREARALLENGTAVKTAALLIGYKHSPSFSRAFKKFFGISPVQLSSRTYVKS